MGSSIPVDASDTPSPAPRVSVVVPTYNRVGYVTRLLDSLAAQTFSDWEAIVVDDGSTDETPATLAVYARRDSRIRVFRHTNAGPVHTINRGMRAARGAYLTWCGDDDVYEPDALAAMVAVLDSQPDVGLVTTDFVQFSDDGAEAVRALSGLPIRDGLAVGLGRLFRRSAWAASGPCDRAAELVEDYELWLRMERAGVRIAQIPRPLYRFRSHPGSGGVARADEAGLMGVLVGTCYGVSGPRDAVETMYWLCLKQRGRGHDLPRPTRYLLKLALAAACLPVWLVGRRGLAASRIVLTCMLWPQILIGRPPFRLWGPFRSSPPADGPELAASVGS